MAKHKSGTKTRLFTANFTLLLLGQVSSLFGNVTLRFALSMYVLDLTGSAGVFSLITAASMLPTVLLSPLGGVLADRADRRRIMVTLDTLSALAVVVAALCLPLNETGHDGCTAHLALSAGGFCLRRYRPAYLRCSPAITCCAATRS